MSTTSTLSEPIAWSRIVFRLLLAATVGTIGVSLLVFLRMSSVLMPAATVVAVTLMHTLSQSTRVPANSSRLAIAYDELLNHYPGVQAWLSRGSRALTMIQGIGWGIAVAILIWIAGLAIEPVVGAGTASFIATVGIMTAFYSLRGLRRTQQSEPSPLAAAIAKAYPGIAPHLAHSGPKVVIAQSFVRALGVQVLRALIVWIAAGLTSVWLGAAAVGVVVLLVTVPELVREQLRNLKTPDAPADTATDTATDPSTV